MKNSEWNTGRKSSYTEDKRLWRELEHLNAGTEEPDLAYLRLRIRPALEALIAAGYTDRLYRLASLQLISPQLAKRYAAVAAQCGRPEAAALLHRLAGFASTPLRDEPGDAPEAGGATPSFDQANTSARNFCPTSPEIALAGRTLRLCQKELSLSLPELSAAVYAIALRADDRAALAGTDGQTVYYCPHTLLAAYRRDPRAVNRLLFHLVLHCLFHHPRLAACASPEEKQRWDSSVEALLDRLALPCTVPVLSPLADDHSLWSRAGDQPAASAASDLLSQIAPVQKNGKPRQKPAGENNAEKTKDPIGGTEGPGEATGAQGGGAGNRSDTTPVSVPRTASGLLPPRAEAHIRRLLLDRAGRGRRPAPSRPGLSSGSQTALLTPKPSPCCDYGSLLRLWAVTREERTLDPENFDPIGYIFGLAHYGNIPLLEPLETREMHKLCELVIALDTSGSCSGARIQRFLDETWSILSNDTWFFDEMNLHIIQCDSVIQNKLRITSREELKRCGQQITVQGFGGTDFRPVFDYTKRLIRQGEFHRLAGIIYFTDGQGIFPEEPPPVPAAFVLTGDDAEHAVLPDWAIRVRARA